MRLRIGTSMDVKARDMVLQKARAGSRIREELAWRPLIQFEEGLGRTVVWYLENQDWVEGVITGECPEYYRSVYASK